MSWIALLFFVSSFVDGLKTFGNLEDYQFVPVTQKKCVLPRYPENGSYIVINDTKAGPGDAFDDLSLIGYTSNEYFALEIVYLVCVRGAWSPEILKRVPRPIVPWNQWINQQASPNTNTNQECCKLPPYPENGMYVVAGDASAKPGDERASATLEYACHEDYNLIGEEHIRCENGTWYDAAPQCLKIPGYGSEFKTQLLTQNVSDLCELPVHPEHGKYTVLKQFHAGPDDNHTFFQLFYSCEVGYGIVGDAHVNCSNGVWSDELPTCVGGCSLHYKAGISYLCKKWRSLEFSTLCDIYIPNGAEVLPVCDTPYYRSDKDLPPMKCVDGNWNYTAACLPGCGIDFSEKGVSRQGGPGEHVSGGRTARNRELPWHVGIYNKMYKPYMQICGGTIISAKVVVTAAHCFWSDVEGLAPSSRFAVAAGKLYRPWSAPSDHGAQLRDVNDIVIPKRFRGVQTNFQDDIAIVYVSNPFDFNKDAWPVCVDFDLMMDRAHLTAGNLGKHIIMP